MRFTETQNYAGFCEEAKMKTLVEIDSDGVTVWVNGASWLLGRFGRQGIDIHRAVGEQQECGECLFCTHKPTTREDWDVFVTKMSELHGIRVPQRHMPRRFR